VPLDPFELLLGSLSWNEQLVHLERLPARPAVHAAPFRPLHPLLAERLPPLFTHQALAVDLARGGRSVAVATGSGSG
jgi:DEAD/DEAH box helicase domain-containing protein